MSGTGVGGWGEQRPRERLGRELRQRRVLAGLSGPDLARAIGITQSKLSRTETAKFRPDLAVVRRWLEATGTGPAERERILALAEEAATQIAEYQTLFRRTLVTKQRSLLAQEAQAERIRNFQPFQIPGPMQTPRYARVAMLSIRMQQTGLEEAVAARMERGRRLRSAGAPHFHVIVTEPALRYRFWGTGDEDQAETWRNMLEFCRVPTAVVQVIPDGTAYHQAPMCAFVITEFRDPAAAKIVQVELPAAEMTFSGAADLEAYERTWNAMADVALDPEASAKLLRGLLKG